LTIHEYAHGWMAYRYGDNSRPFMLLYSSESLYVVLRIFEYFAFFVVFFLPFATSIIIIPFAEAAA